jgi:hypothetical protein
MKNLGMALIYHASRLLRSACAKPVQAGPSPSREKD